MKRPPIDIVPEEDRRREDLLALLDDITTRVREGHVTDLFIIAGRQDGSSTHAIWEDNISLIGWLSVAHHDALVMDEDEIDEDHEAS